MILCVGSSFCKKHRQRIVNTFFCDFLKANFPFSITSFSSYLKNILDLSLKKFLRVAHIGIRLKKVLLALFSRHFEETILFWIRKNISDCCLIIFDPSCRVHGSMSDPCMYSSVCHFLVVILSCRKRYWLHLDLLGSLCSFGLLLSASNRPCVQVRPIIVYIGKEFCYFFHKLKTAWPC